jgi:hypothetical protein
LNSRGLTIILLVCSLAWAVRGCAIVPWETKETTPLSPPPPNAAAQKTERQSHPNQKVNSGNIAAKEVAGRSEAELRQREQPPPEHGLGPRLQSSPTSRPWVSPDATSGRGQETRPEQALEPRLETGPDRADHLPAPEPAPRSASEPIEEPKLSPESLPLPLLLPPSEPAQAARTQEPVPEPVPSGAPATASPTTPEPRGETASIPEPSALEPTSESKAAAPAREAAPAPPSIFSPEPIAQTPPILLPLGHSSDDWFDEVFGQWRPSETRVPRLLREPAPPLSLSKGEAE